MKHTTYIKTSVELKSEKIDLAKRLGRISTLKELLDCALDAYIAQARRHSMADLLGTDFFDTIAKPVRRTRGHSSR